MTGRDLMLAIGGVDDKYILDAAPDARPKKRGSYIGWVSVAASVALVIAISLIIAVFNPFLTLPDGSVGGTQIPDMIFTFGIGDRMVCTCGRCYAKFDKVYLTRSIGGVTIDGGYLIFEGDTFTDHHYIEATRMGLDLDSLGVSATFMEELSESLSDTENAFDPYTTVLNGRLVLVFQLDAGAYDKLTLEESADKTITLSPDIAWHGGLCLFEFFCRSVSVIDDYSKE